MAGTEEPDVPGVERLLALTDGVVAIALTLLVLQLAVPHFAAAGSAQADSPGKLASALSGLWPQLTAYLVSFYVIAQFWLVHHRVFRQVAGHHESLAWWNFAFLLTITLMPFSSALLGAYPDNPVAVDLFAANLLLATLSTQAVLLFARRRRLLRQVLAPAEARAARLRVTLAAAVLLSSMAVAWASTGLAKLLWLGLVPAPALARWWAAREAAPVGAAAPVGGRPNPEEPFHG